MLSWLKGLFSSPKTFIKLAVDALDYAVPYLGGEIDKIEKTFKDMNSMEKAQWIIDKVQEYLRNKFKLDVV